MSHAKITREIQREVRRLAKGPAMINAADWVWLDADYLAREYLHHFLEKQHISQLDETWNFRQYLKNRGDDPVHVAVLGAVIDAGMKGRHFSARHA